MTNRYQDLTYDGPASLTDAIDRGDPREIGRLVIAAALYEGDFDFVQRTCMTLSAHEDEQVRGNATLGLGHLARRARRLDPPAVAVIAGRLEDPSDYVRDHAYSAASDVSHFLGIELRPDKLPHN